MEQKKVLVLQWSAISSLYHPSFLIKLIDRSEDEGGTDDLPTLGDTGINLEEFGYWYEQIVGEESVIVIMDIEEKVNSPKDHDDISYDFLTPEEVGSGTPIFSAIFDGDEGETFFNITILPTVIEKIASIPVLVLERPSDGDWTKARPLIKEVVIPEEELEEGDDPDDNFIPLFRELSFFSLDTREKFIIEIRRPYYFPDKSYMVLVVICDEFSEQNLHTVDDSTVFGFVDNISDKVHMQGYDDVFSMLFLKFKSDGISFKTQVVPELQRRFPGGYPGFFLTLGFFV